MTGALRRVALWLAFRYPFPSMITTSMPGAAKNHFYLVRFLEGTEVVAKFVAKKRVAYGIEGLWFSFGDTGYPATLLAQHEGDFDPLFIHYYRGYEFRYRSSAVFVFHCIGQWARIYRAVDILAQLTFNRRPLVRKARLDLLSYIYECTLIDRDYEVSAFGLMTDFFTHRWISHPDHGRTQNHYTLLLRSLADDGDLEKKKYGYILAPRALTTLSAHEEEERRHRDHKSRQTILAVLTGALLVVAVPQALAAAVEAYRFFFP